MSVTETTDGVTIAWESHGDGFPVVFVHGVTEDATLWDPVIETFPAGFRLIRLDLRGHGRSGLSDDLSALSMTRDIAAVVSASNAHRPAVIGHSLGGFVATAYAAEEDVAAVVNVDMAMHLPGVATRLRPLQSALREASYRDTMKTMFRAMGGDRLSDSARAMIDNYAEHARQDVLLGVYAMIFERSDGELLAMCEAMLRSISVPYLALHGSEPGDDYRIWLARQLPRLTLEAWPDAGHFLQLREPDRFARRVGEFLQESVASTTESPG